MVKIQNSKLEISESPVVKQDSKQKNQLSKIQISKMIWPVFLIFLIIAMFWGLIIWYDLSRFSFQIWPKTKQVSIALATNQNSKKDQPFHYHSKNYGYDFDYPVNLYITDLQKPTCGQQPQSGPKKYLDWIGIWSIQDKKMISNMAVSEKNMTDVIKDFKTNLYKNFNFFTEKSIILDNITGTQMTYHNLFNLKQTETTVIFIPNGSRTYIMTGSFSRINGQQSDFSKIVESFRFSK